MIDYLSQIVIIHRRICVASVISGVILWRVKLGIALFHRGSDRYYLGR